MSDIRPNFTIARCCKTCHYFKVNANAAFEGHCILAQVTDPTASPVGTHMTFTCDAHTWRAAKGIIHKWAVKYGARIPDEVL